MNKYQVDRFNFFIVQNSVEKLMVKKHRMRIVFISEHGQRMASFFK